MRTLTIIFPSDPFGGKVGGAETIIHDIVRHAPWDFSVEFFGVTSDPVRRPVANWTRLWIGGKEFSFFPLCCVKSDNQKSIFPLSLRFSLHLSRCQEDFSGRMLLFNRIEPALFLKKVGSPRVAIIHNDVRAQVLGKNSECSWRWFPWLYFKVEKAIFRSLNRVYCVHSGTAGFYREHYSEKKERFLFLPTWADQKLFSVSAEAKARLRETSRFAERGFPTAKRWVLFVGRFQEQKAPGRVVDAFAEYHRRDPDSCLIMVGDGDLRRPVENRIESLNLKADVFLTGPVAREELPWFYQASDCLLLASHFEGMPVCVLEALNCGLPVVSTEVGEIERVVESGCSGEMVSDFSIRAVAAALDRVLKNPQEYPPDRCVASAAPYTAERVLEPFFDGLRELHSGYMVRNTG